MFLDFPSGLASPRAVPCGLLVGPLALSSTGSNVALSLFLAGPVRSPATGQLQSVVRLGVLFLVVTHPAKSRAALASRGSLLVPLADPGLTVGFPGLGF